MEGAKEGTDEGDGEGRCRRLESERRRRHRGETRAQMGELGRRGKGASRDVRRATPPSSCNETCGQLQYTPQLPTSRPSQYPDATFMLAPYNGVVDRDTLMIEA